MRHITVSLPEHEYAWLRKNLNELDVGYRTPVAWKVARNRLQEALEAASNEDVS